MIIDEHEAIYSVYVGGLEVNEVYLTQYEAECLAESYLDDDYDDIAILNMNEGW